MAEERLPRIGVIVCRCGGEINSTLNVDYLLQQVASLPGVVYTSTGAYPCSKDGQSRLQQAIQEQRLERLLVAGCTAQLIEKLFRRMAEIVGLHPSYVTIANIREQCVNVHAEQPVRAQRKAIDLIAMGVNQLTTIRPAHSYSSKIIPAAMIVGGDIVGLTTALTLADNGIDVTLVEAPKQSTSMTLLYQDQEENLLASKVGAVRQHSRIHNIKGARLTNVTGIPGNYHVTVTQNGKVVLHDVGAVVLTGDSLLKRQITGQWIGKTPTMSLYEAQMGLPGITASGNGSGSQVVIILPVNDHGPSARLNGRLAIHLAISLKEMDARSHVTILFQDPDLTDPNKPDFVAAKESGVSFIPYREHQPPVIGDRRVTVVDPITGERMHLPCDQVFAALLYRADAYLSKLAALFRLPQDQENFVIEPRIRLYPEMVIDDGVYAIGFAHQPLDLEAALLEAYVTCGRVLHFLRQDSIRKETPVAEIDPALCTGCGSCVEVCPTQSIEMIQRSSKFSLAGVNWARCIGCGNCVVTCSAKAISLPEWDDLSLMGQISAAFGNGYGLETVIDSLDPSPRIVALACNWSASIAADLAGSRRIPYPPGVRLIRLNCSARIDPSMVLWALLNGADGVALGACGLGECHYGHGNIWAMQRMANLKQQMADRGIDPRRIRLFMLSGDDAKQFAAEMTEFAEEIKLIWHTFKIPTHQEQAAG